MSAQPDHTVKVIIVGLIQTNSIIVVSNVVVLLLLSVDLIDCVLIPNQVLQLR